MCLRVRVFPFGTYFVAKTTISNALGMSVHLFVGFSLKTRELM